MESLPLEFWVPVPIKPQAAIAALYTHVLNRSEKRSPKWKFRFAQDIVVQIQPKVSKSLYLFECLALQCEGADARLLASKRRDIDRAYYRIKFILRAPASDQWSFKACGLGWHKSEHSLEAFIELRTHLVTLLENRLLDHISPTLMLAPSCLCCGKALTDPVSMARFIGPECAGTFSDDLPFILEPNKPTTVVLCH
jgi:hypothetical protein